MLSHWPALLLVALGGALGGALRYGVSGWVARRVGETFPWGTLVVNTSGAFVLGLLMGAAGGLPVAQRELWLLFCVGVLGSYTTVSSLSLQALLLARDGQRGRAWGYVGLSLAAGAAAVVGGWWLLAP
ncbi:MAG: CrcB family protein [Rehaibacterium terrae]|uniref:CrcB family protein n=1 Tax=Rehaibacterium terrae TaxID=1341696 RepID=UPI00391D7942